MVNHHIQGRNVVGKNLKWSEIRGLVKSDGKISTAELMAVFNSESKSISARTVQRETKWLGPNSCVALKLFIIESNMGKKGFN